MPFLKPVRMSYNQRKMETIKRNGQRHAIFSAKSKGLFKGYYIGEWKDDKKYGKGNELDRDGWIYEGNWLDGKKHGTGVLSKVAKSGVAYLAYIGEWLCGKKHGFGYHWYEDGNYYEGDFWRNKRQGYGQMWFCNGEYYEGNWENNLFHGKGMLVKANGNRYEGEFVEGKRVGYGTFYHIVTGQEQRGFWVNDSCVRGSMSDMYWRQSAPRPTPYPIPPHELAEDIDDTEIEHEINEEEEQRIVETAVHERVCKKRPKRVIPDICVAVNTCPCLEAAQSFVDSLTPEER